MAKKKSDKREQAAAAAEQSRQMEAAIVAAIRNMTPEDIAAFDARIAAAVCLRFS